MRRTHRAASRWIILAAALLLTPATLPAEAPDATGAAVGDAARLFSLWAEEQMEYHGIPAAAVGVVHDGRLIWARGFGSTEIGGSTPVTPATLFRLGSVSKVFTATALMQLRDRGLLDLDDPVARHLPWFRLAEAQDQEPGERRRDITVRDLLTHTAGLPRDGPFPYWTTHVFPTAGELREALPGVRPFRPPGEVYRYSNLGLALAGQVLTTLSKADYAETLRRQIFAPLGMTASTAAPDARQILSLPAAYRRKLADGSRRRHAYYDTGALAPTAAVLSTVEDLARFVALHQGLGPRSAGAAGDEPVLARDTALEMQRPHFVHPSWTGGRGLGFGISRRDGTTYVAHAGWIGGHRAEILLDPARGLAAIALTNADDASPALFTRQAIALFAAALAPPVTAPDPATPDPGWSRLVGRYTDPWDAIHQVLVLEGRLAVYEHGYPPEDDPEDSLVFLTPVGPPGGTRFTMGDGEAFEFELDAQGKVQRIKRRHEFLAPVD